MDDHDEAYVDDCCQYCKSFSSSNFRMKKGYCMKLRKAVKRDGYCGYFKPDIKVEYQMECKPIEKTSVPPKNRFSN